jgi:hypothetical protein
LAKSSFAKLVPDYYESIEAVLAKLQRCALTVPKHCMHIEAEQERIEEELRVHLGVEGAGRLYRYPDVAGERAARDARERAEDMELNPPKRGRPAQRNGSHVEPPRQGRDER